MTAEYLSKVGSALVRRCGTRDPFKIAKELGIEVLFCEGFGPLKGMYRVVKRNRFIFINQDMSEQMQRIVCAHELGHDQLHRSLAKNNAIQEFMLYDMRSTPEYEANIVASEILLDTDEIQEYSKVFLLFQASKSFGTGSAFAHSLFSGEIRPSQSLCCMVLARTKETRSAPKRSTTSCTQEPSKRLSA